ncbi:MAG: prepilin-type N-terminal cleavage/methylation domain-containing protein [Candidatus Alcyoniella australis]|nr:prepilin-type N-terminal cleavage/methylation domain-containing protein [Candidatus Alcyoniella australis]
MSRRGGFTLLEVMVAIAIMATVMVALLQNHAFSISLSESARNQTLAAQLARLKITDIELLGYPPLEDDEGDFGELFPGFTWRVEVDESFFPDVREVHLLILWQEGPSPRELDLLYFIADTGPFPNDGQDKGLGIPDDDDGDGDGAFGGGGINDAGTPVSEAPPERAL